eukprot:6477482-Prymnesium_polylepis.2
MGHGAHGRAGRLARRRDRDAANAVRERRACRGSAHVVRRRSTHLDKVGVAHLVLALLTRAHKPARVDRRHQRRHVTAHADASRAPREHAGAQDVVAALALARVVGGLQDPCVELAAQPEEDVDGVAVNLEVVVNHQDAVAPLEVAGVLGGHRLEVWELAALAPNKLVGRRTNLRARRRVVAAVVHDAQVEEARGVRAAFDPLRHVRAVAGGREDEPRPTLVQQRDLDPHALTQLGEAKRLELGVELGLGRAREHDERLDVGGEDEQLVHGEAGRRRWWWRRRRRRRQRKRGHIIIRLKF